MQKTNRNIYWIIAGVLNALTALIHLIGGQIDLVQPLLNSGLTMQAKAEWLGVWHVVSVLLFASSYVLLKGGLNTSKSNPDLIHLIGILYVLFSVVFILSSFYTKMFAPQWVLLLPIGLLSLRKNG